MESVGSWGPDERSKRALTGALTGELYLDLLERCLTDSLRDVEYAPLSSWTGRRRFLAPIDRLLRLAKMSVVVDVTDQREAARSTGRDWPVAAETMVGARRLRNVRDLVTRVVHDDIPGDLIETGVWRGGVTVLMRGVLAALGDADRQVWVADSFAGLPPPDPRWPADTGAWWHLAPTLAVGIEEVRSNFARYGLLDERVRFLPGFFEDTLAHAPIDRLALIRLDGDMYGSTMVALESLYPRLSPGGFLIVDDFGGVPACRQAVLDYRAREGVSEPVQEIDWTGVYWRRDG